MEVFLLIAMGVTNILCFMIGAKVGQQVANGVPVELPKVDPMKAVQEHRAKKEAEFQQSRIDTILENIENYDGTGNGQKEVPRG